MSEVTSTPAPAPALASTADQAPYVPISWMAVAALTVAGVFVATLATFGIAAFTGKKPLILPELLVLPFIGVVLSFAARRMIRNSEGTRTGERQANAAWWTCVVVGLGYAAYLFAIDFSIRREAQAEAERWVGLVLKGDVDKAFHRTLDPDRRANVQPERSELEAQYRSGYVAFSQMDVVQLAKRNPGACEFRPTTVKEWNYRPGLIECLFTGEIRCPEGIFPISIPMRGVEAGAGSETVGRQWAVIATVAGMMDREKVRITPFGWRMEELQASGGSFGREFITAAGNGPSMMPYVYHVMVKNRDHWLGAQVFFQLRLWPGPSAALVLPYASDYGEYLRKDMFSLFDGEPASAEQKAAFENVWKTMGLFPAGRRIPGNDRIDAHDVMTVTEKAVEVRVPCDVPLPGTTGARGRVVVVCDDPEVLAELNRLRSEADPERGTPTPPPDFGSRQFKWRVVRVESDLYEVRPTQQGPGGPDAPPPAMPPG